MTAFRLKTQSGEPEPGDVLEASATGNRWRVHAVRRVNTRTVDPVYAGTWSLEVERVDRDTSPADGGRLWPFERLR